MSQRRLSDSRFVRVVSKPRASGAPNDYLLQRRGVSIRRKKRVTQPPLSQVLFPSPSAPCFILFAPGFCSVICGEDREVGDGRFRDEDADIVVFRVGWPEVKAGLDQQTHTIVHSAFNHLSIRKPNAD